jgi:hypothetical protein
MNGDTTGTVQDTENYDAPYPEYTYRWKTLDAVSVHIKVEYEANDGLPSDINAQIRTVVLNAFTGADGGTRACRRANLWQPVYRPYSGARCTEHERAFGPDLWTEPPGLVR